MQEDTAEPQPVPRELHTLRVFMSRASQVW
jgi:hypothetical protein